MLCKSKTAGLQAERLHWMNQAMSQCVWGMVVAEAQVTWGQVENSSTGSGLASALHAKGILHSSHCSCYLTLSKQWLSRPQHKGSFSGVKGCSLCPASSSQHPRSAGSTAARFFAEQVWHPGQQLLHCWWGSQRPQCWQHMGTATGSQSQSSCGQIHARGSGRWAPASPGAAGEVCEVLAVSLLSHAPSRQTQLRPSTSPVLLLAPCRLLPGSPSPTEGGLSLWS